MAKGKGSIYDPYKLAIITLFKDGKSAKNIVEHLNDPKMMAGKANQPALYKWLHDRKDDPDIASYYRKKEKDASEPVQIEKLELFYNYANQRRIDFAKELQSLYGSPDNPPDDPNMDPYNVEYVTYQFMARAEMILHDKQSNPLAIKLAHDIYKGALEMRTNFATQPTNNEVVLNMAIEGESNEQFRRFINQVGAESTSEANQNNTNIKEPEPQLDLFAA